ncbi:MAG: hypothetical protein WBH45_04370, partial [Acidobacteriaceae bacterium]
AGRTGHQRGLPIQSKAIRHVVASAAAIPQQGTPYLTANRANKPFSERLADMSSGMPANPGAGRRRGREDFPGLFVD